MAPPAFSTPLPRSAGVLLHPSSLPGPHGIGDLGPEAYRWVQTLAAARQSWWQILPLGPTGAGDSPYQSFSAFAGNVALLSPDLLRDEGLLPDAFQPPPGLPRHEVDYSRVLPYKAALVREAYAQFRGGRGPATLKADFAAYVEREASWLADYALFMAVRAGLGGAGLAQWPAELKRRDPVALAQIEKQLDDEVQVVRFGQFLFDRQWDALKAFAHGHGLRIIGDAPIFVSGDSADVWAQPQEYLLDPERRPSVVAGVPPDYFSPTGQLWGNPLYNWDRMAETGFAWWVARLKRNLAQVDLVRLDHFRGFAAAWHVPASETTALKGRWVDGPRDRLFTALEAALGKLPIIAEDLGLITPDVDQLRLNFRLPGMRVLQFATPDPANNYWPHNYDPASVVYTGTHDNNTTVGWYDTLPAEKRWAFCEYVGRDIARPARELLRLAWSSVSQLAIAPLQDVLELGADARMNTPGLAEGNWKWRVLPEQFHAEAVEQLANWTGLYHRVPTEGTVNQPTPQALAAMAGANPFPFKLEG